MRNKALSSRLEGVADRILALFYRDMPHILRGREPVWFPRLERGRKEDRPPLRGVWRERKVGYSAKLKWTGRLDANRA